jgi:hypothetical protein
MLKTEQDFPNTFQISSRKVPDIQKKSQLTFVPMTTCLSPGTKNEQSAYSQVIVRMHCSVDL